MKLFEDVEFKKYTKSIIETILTMLFWILVGFIVTSSIIIETYYVAKLIDPDAAPLIFIPIVAGILFWVIFFNLVDQKFKKQKK